MSKRKRNVTKQENQSWTKQQYSQSTTPSEIFLPEKSCLSITHTYFQTIRWAKQAIHHPNCHSIKVNSQPKAQPSQNHWLRLLNCQALQWIHHA